MFRKIAHRSHEEFALRLSEPSTANADKGCSIQIEDYEYNHRHRSVWLLATIKEDWEIAEVIGAEVEPTEFRFHIGYLLESLKKDSVIEEYDTQEGVVEYYIDGHEKRYVEKIDEYLTEALEWDEIKKGVRYYLNNK